LHEGDADPGKAIWSSSELVTLFGAEVERAGRPEIESTFEWVASRFKGCRSFEYDVVAAGASDDLGYLVAYEHVTATVGGEKVSYVLRSTTVFRKESVDADTSSTPVTWPGQNLPCWRWLSDSCA
jgi:ketosteroid isomerase-like protein